MMIDMLDEVYKDITAEDQGGTPADPFADEMRKALEESHKKMDDLKKQIDDLAKAGFSIDNENKDPEEDGTENTNESEEEENEDQNT